MSKKIERALIFELARANDFNRELITELMDNNVIDYPWLLGQLLFNRVGGMAYSVLAKCGLLGAVNREFRNTLKNIFQIQKIKSEAFLEGLAYLSNVFDNADFPYAFLKGSFLIQELYEPGQRVSNDYDILVSQKDLTKITGLLKENGFIQGKCDFNNMKITESTRFEILNSRMNRGETVPFFKPFGKSGMEYLEIDINFSLDYKALIYNGNIDAMLRDAVMFNTNDKPLFTLSRGDFFIYLCIHLYKEAAVYNWVEMQRDLSLYKFCDIYVYFMRYYAGSNPGHMGNISALKDKILQYGLEKECYYTLVNTGEFYPQLTETESYLYLTEAIKPSDTGYLKEITDPSQNKKYKYEFDFTDWFFKHDRAECLKKGGDSDEA